MIQSSGGFSLELLIIFLPTNDWLYKIKLKDNDVCYFCKKEKETIPHLFANCEEVNLFWHNVQVCFNIQGMQNLTPFRKMYGLIDTKSDNSLIINQIILIAKYYVYKCKIIETKLSLIAFKNLLADVEKLEYFCAKKKAKEGLHLSKWSPIRHLM